MDSQPQPQPWSLNCRGKLLTFSQPAVMGILNLTPDSFFEGSRIPHAQQAVERATEMLNQGADILDLGAQSSRPGAETIGPDAEWERLAPALHAIRAAHPAAVLSIDTFHAAVAERSLDAGADLINDISAGDLDPEMHDVVARHRCPYVFMHMRGTPETMQTLTEYDNVVGEVFLALDRRLRVLREKGLVDLIADPGFGFGKTVEQNWTLLRHLRQLVQLGVPVLAGVSRKSMVYKLLNITPQESLPATSAAHMVALQQGAQLLRVHDVAEAVQVRRMFLQLQPA
ncbi:MAG: dihydropteroate synthase [Flavobacteriales bacterium]